MTVVASCGHTLTEEEGLGINCSLKSVDREFNRSIDYVSYCKQCYAEAVAKDAVLENTEDEYLWLANIKQHKLNLMAAEEPCSVTDVML